MRVVSRNVGQDQRRAAVLAGLIVLQGLCAAFFISDVITDFRVEGVFDDPHLLAEAVAALALVGGVAYMMVELRRLLQRMGDMRTALAVAHGKLSDVMTSFFDAWELTAAERDVAMMILKGLDNDTIATLRNTASGTVRAQSTSIYAKSGSHGRAQFISLFVEELMAGALDEDAAPPPASRAARDGRPPLPASDTAPPP
jgi:DNA-binding CsgD family transcriptional regulator